MIKVVLEFAGNGYIRWSSKDKDILQHIEDYVRYESRRPLAERVPHPTLEVMERTAVELRDLVENAGKHEGKRSEAKGEYDNLIATMKVQGEQIIGTLKAIHIDNLHSLEQWGIQVVTGKYGAKARKPSGNKQWMLFFDTYLRQEASLPLAERQTIVPLADMQAQWTALQQYDQIWRAETAQRQATIEKRRLLAQEALQLLKWALVSLVMGQHQGKATEELERWGYRLVKG